MNISATFHIEVKVFRTGKKYRMLVDHYYSSAQVERFKIHGKNERFVLMEKRLSLHKQPWKILEGTIDTSNVEQAAMAVRDIQDAIDDYLKQRKNNIQDEGHVLPEK
jgi:hypothetical protein